MTPDTISVSDGRASGQLTVDYEITNSDRVEKAELELWAPGVGRVAKEPVAVIGHGSVTISVNSNRDLGPSVRFRVRCPDGDSDWVPLGTRGVRVPEDDPAVRIANVRPEYISLDRVLINNNGEVPPNTGAMVALSGPRIGEGCQPEVMVGRHSVELANVYVKRGSLVGIVEGFLRYEQVGNRYVSSRFLEVKLKVAGPGVGRMALVKVPFAE